MHGISVVVPALNEGRNLEVLVPETIDSMERLGRPYEVLCINDGSTDDSFSVVRRFHEKDSRIKCVQFVEHLGKTMAFMVGFEAASYPVIVTMDADLQNDPADIPGLVAKLEEGYDLVCGWRTRRKDVASKRVASAVYNFLTSLLLGPRLHDHNCGLKSYRGEVVKRVRLASQTHRYITSIVHLSGHRVTEMPVSHRARVWGSSRYGLARLLRGLLDLVYLVYSVRLRRQHRRQEAGPPGADEILPKLSARVLF